MTDTLKVVEEDIKKTKKDTPTIWAGIEVETTLGFLELLIEQAEQRGRQKAIDEITIIANNEPANLVSSVVIKSLLDRLALSSRGLCEEDEERSRKKEVVKEKQ